MIDNYTFSRFSKEEYKQYLFPNKKDFFHFRNMFFACRAIMGGRGYENDVLLKPKTEEFRRLYQKEILDKALDLQGIHEKYGYLLPMEQMRDNPEFQRKFTEHLSYLSNIMRNCIVEYNPAETVLNECEICFVLYTFPEQIEHVRDQTCNMQKIVLSNNQPRLAKLIRNPASTLVRDFSADIIASIPYDQCGIDFDMMALMFEKLPIEEIHYEQIPEWLKNHINTTSSCHFPVLVKGIEKLGVPVFGAEVMEQMRLSFIQHEDCNYNWRLKKWSYEPPVLTYMKNPSQNVKEASVKHNPYSVGVIKYQYDAIQELALRRCKELAGAYSNTWSQSYGYDESDNPWNLQALYNQCLKNPSVMVKKVYEDLQR